MRIVGILIAAVVALAAAYFVYNVMNDGNKPIVVETAAQQGGTIKVLVAAREIELGESLDATAVQTADWPEHLVSDIDGFVTEQDDIQTVMGRIVRSPFVKGEPLNMKRLSNPEDPNFIAAHLPEGMRMATVSSDAIAGLAGFVYPGDRVDVLITHKFSLLPEVTEATNIRETSMTETLISNIRVLAVNQRATVEPVSDEGTGAEDRDRIPTSVSLEVSVADAAKLRLAQETGYVSLALRSLKDKDAQPEHVLVTEPDVTVADDEGYIRNPLDVDLEEDKDVVSLVLGTEKKDIEIKKKKEEETEDTTESEVQEESDNASTSEEVEQELEEIIE